MTQATDWTRNEVVFKGRQGKDPEMSYTDGGMAITKLGSEIDAIELQTIPIVRAYHPEPRAINEEATQKILDMIEGIKPGENVLELQAVNAGAGSQ